MDGTAATICVAVPVPTVESAVVPQNTTAPVAKFVPVAVRLNPPLPAAIEVELKLVSVGPLTLKDDAFEVAPPGF